LKIIVLGDSGVGKTSLLVRYVDNKFSLATKSTIGADFLSKQIEVDDQAVTLQIWDTAGQERFQGLGTTFYRGSDGAMFVFDVSRKDTFDSLVQWKKAFLIQVGQEGNDNFPMIVIANKIDREDRAISPSMIQKFCQENSIEYVECSAKDAINVNKAFEKVTKQVISQMKPEDIQYDTVKLDMPGTTEENTCC
jgi:Ras-related protein Rab-7A